jgi:hypothetical protein
MMTGPALQRALADAFPLLRECVRRQGTDEFTLNFYHPGWSIPVQPAQQTAAELTRHLPNAIPVRYHDTTAQWRENQPVIATSVTVKLTRFSVGETAFIPGTQRWSRILEVNADPRLTQPYYRVRLIEGMEHKWYGESALITTSQRELDELDRHIEALPEQLATIPPSRALMCVERAA